MGLFLAPPGAQVVALSVCLSVCTSVHYFYEFFTHSSLNLNAVSQLSSLLGVSQESLGSLSEVSFGSLFWDYLGSLSGVSRESLSTLSHVSCSQLPHSLHCTKSILHQTSGAQNTSSCYEKNINLHIQFDEATCLYY